VYLSGPGLDPGAVLFGRTMTMEKDLGAHLGVDYRERPEPDDEKAWLVVREEVLAGRPTMLSGDILYLDYRDYKVHFPGHRFVLVGFDDDWSEPQLLPRHELRFTSLPHGEYRFELMAVDVDGDESAVVRSMPLIVPRPRWMSPWYWALSLVLLGIPVFMVVAFVLQRRHAVELEREVKRRTDEVRELELERIHAQGLRTISLLAGGIAHDFNNVLTAVSGNLELLRTTADLAEDDRKTIASVLKSCLRASSLTKQLLTFSRASTPVRRVGDLAPLLRDSCRFAMSGSSLGYTLDIDESLWQADFDAGQISHTIHNLLLNARQSCGENGNVIVRARNLLSERAPYVAIEVEDDGPGIPPENVDGLFQPYFTTKHDGNGIGLAIAKEVVRLHGGYLAVVSAPDGGARFVIDLPVVAVTQDTSADLSQTAGVSHSGE